MKVWVVWYQGLKGPEIHKFYDSLTIKSVNGQVKPFASKHELTEEQIPLSLDKLEKIYPAPEMIYD